MSLKIGAIKYLECSSLEQNNLTDILIQAVDAATEESIVVNHKSFQIISCG